MKIKKTKLFINYQKKERWINEMAADGWHLVKCGFMKYTFERGDPGKYDYCIELLSDAPTTEKGKEYLAFMEEAGIEHVTQFLLWAYFRKEATGEPFEIYTDYDSRKRHLTRIITALSIVMVMNLVFAISNTIIAPKTTLSININLYMAILNWIIVIVVTPMIIGYIKNMMDLKQGR